MPDIPTGFEGEVIAKWLTQDDDDRDMELIADFAFFDHAGKRWVALQSTVVNGASIPEPLWSGIVGTPYIGNYRRATVLHDAYYRDPRGETRKAVDDMFREAMLADGVSEERAKLMYTAVRLFGGSAWSGEAAVRAPTAPGPSPGWSEFEAWYESEGAGLEFENIDHALKERFGPISN